jgi:hypothetical protein
VTGKPSLSIEELLTRYAQYDQRRRRPPHFQVHPSKAGFVDGVPDAGLGRTRQTLRNYEQSNNLPWPLLPEDLDALVLVLFAQPPYPITWARESVARTLGYPEDEVLVGQSALELLNGPGARLELLLRCLHDNTPATTGATLGRTWVQNAAGDQVPVRIDARYTGRQSERFYLCATAVEAADMPPEPEPFNVHPDYVFEPKRVASLVSYLQRLNDNPDELRTFYDKSIGTYRYPGQAAED